MLLVSMFRFYLGSKCLFSLSVIHMFAVVVVNLKMQIYVLTICLKVIYFPNKQVGDE